MKTSVLIADDHAIVRDGLRAILEASGEVTVSGVAGTGREAVDLAKRERPDVILMDIAMPDLNGIEATEKICHDRPGTRVIILSMHDSSEHVFRALRAGALGYLLKESAGSEVLEAIRAVASGQRYLSKRISDRVVEGFLQAEQAATHESPLEKLSQREREILQLVAEGHSSAQAAKLLHLSPKTVETYRSRLMAKIGVSDLGGLIRFAIQHGISPSP